MAKTTIRSLFVGSLIAFGGALVLLGVAGGLALASGSLVRDGPDVTGIRETPFGWVMVGLAAVAIVVMLAAAVTQFVAWVGAVINTAGLKDKTWFIILLVTGLLSFGFMAMIIYLIAGPDDSPPLHAAPAAGEAHPGICAAGAHRNSRGYHALAAAGGGRFTRRLLEPIGFIVGGASGRVVPDRRRHGRAEPSSRWPIR